MSAPDVDKKIDSNINLVAGALQDEENWYPFKEQRTRSIVTGTTTYDLDEDIKEILYVWTTDGPITIFTPDILAWNYPNTSDITDFIAVTINYKAKQLSAYKAETITLYLWCRVRANITDLLSLGGGFPKLIKYGVLREMSRSGTPERMGYEKDYKEELAKLKVADANREFDGEFEIKPPQHVIDFQSARQGIIVV